MSKNENSLLAVPLAVPLAVIDCVAAYIEESPQPIALLLRPFILQIAIICVAVQVGWVGGLAKLSTYTIVVKAT